MYGFFYAQSEYSIGNNTIHLNSLIEKAKEYGYSFLALSDNFMHSFYKAIRMCENASIKPIIGLEIEVEKDTLLLYAKNYNGLKNLFKITSYKETDNKITFDYIKKHNKDIFMVTAGSKSRLEIELVNNNLDKVFEYYLLYKETFNEFYIGLEKDVFPFDEFYDVIKNFAINNEIKYLPIHQTLFLKKEDLESYVVLKKINKIDVEETNYRENYLKTIDELKLEFNDEDAFKYVEEVVSSIDIKVNPITNPLIKYPSGANISSIDYLRELCYLGIQKRLNNNVGKEYKKRLDYELDVINKMGYADYFLIVFDFIRYAKKNNILVGPGRGSAAGSLVAYSIGITDINPIKYDLYFERFLNPERITMPDIDVDLPDDKRLEVIDYITRKYGNNHVSFISTFDSFKGKSALNDVSKVFGLDDLETTDLIKKCLVFDSETNKDIVTKESIKNAYKLVDKDDYKKVLINSYKLIDLPKAISTHAAGIILSSDELTDNYPIMKSNNGYQSQLEAVDLESLGLLKMDLLSLKNLTLLDNILKKVGIKLNDIPLDDENTFKLLNSGDTKGIFQLEGRGITNTIKKYNVKSFMDLANLLALYRPGPMGEIDDYIARKEGKEFSYPAKSIEHILKPTYGVIVYQEQIMQIAYEYANYSLGEADVLRRAISKKKKEVLDTERDNFVSRCSNKEEANKIYDYIVKFASYGFNKSHSVSYAMLTYALAYLKANYLKEFITTFLNDSISDIKGSIIFFNTLRKNGIEVVNPDINISTDEYVIDNDKIYLPLQIIKTINKDSINLILEERRKGLFTSFIDFYKRVDIPDEQRYNLIYASCFDGCIKDMVNYVKYRFDNTDIIKNNEFEYEELVRLEETALGFNLKYSYLEMHRKEYDDLTELVDLKDENAKVLVTIKFIKEITTKKDETMAFVTIYDGLMQLECSLFPNKYFEVMNILNEKAKVKYDKDICLLELKPFKRNGATSYEIIKAKKL